MRKLMTVIAMVVAFLLVGLFTSCAHASASGPPLAVSGSQGLRSNKQIVPVQTVAVKDVSFQALLSNKTDPVKERVGHDLAIETFDQLHVVKELAGYRTVEDKPKIFCGIGHNHFARADV